MQAEVQREENRDKEAEKKQECEEEGLRIRAHHGLCTAFFRGKGYSEAFTAHMTEVISQLKDNPPIFLTDREDDICAACPNLKDGRCSEKNKVDRYDRQVLALCGIKKEMGKTVTWESFRKAVEEKIIRTGRRREVCGDCEWDSICEETWKKIEEADNKTEKAVLSS